MAKAPESAVDPRDIAIAELREQLVQLSRTINGARGVGEPKPPKIQPVYARAPWEEEIWVEALEDLTYPDPPTGEENEIEYATVRSARQMVTDDQGNPKIVRGGIFLLKHREHLNKAHHLLSDKEIDDLPAVVKRVPQTTQRNRRLRPQRAIGQFREKVIQS